MTELVVKMMDGHHHRRRVVRVWVCVGEERIFRLSCEKERTNVMLVWLVTHSTTELTQILEGKVFSGVVHFNT